MFTTPLKLMFVGGGQYQLLDDLVFEAPQYIVTVKSGFIWNGANIPHALQSLIGCPMDFAYESCLHDALYGSKLFSRKDCDKLFHKALLTRGVSAQLAKAMYLAVRVGGEENYSNFYGVSNYRELVAIGIKG